MVDVCFNAEYLIMTNLWHQHGPCLNQWAVTLNNASIWALQKYAGSMCGKPRRKKTRGVCKQVLFDPGGGKQDTTEAPWGNGQVYAPNINIWTCNCDDCQTCKRGNQPTWNPWRVRDGAPRRGGLREPPHQMAISKLYCRQFTNLSGWIFNIQQVLYEDGTTRVDLCAVLERSAW